MDDPSTAPHLAKAEAAGERITKVLRSGRPLSVSWSAGKDSSATLNLVLAAAVKLKRAGERVPPIVVTHGDTGIENPEIARHARREMKKIRAFAETRGLDVQVRVARPSLSQSWAFRTIGQGKLPTFPGDARECSVEFKVKPQSRLLKGLASELEAETGQPPVVVMGTRFNESAERLARMKERGERVDGIWTGANGFDCLSPIADWSVTDVWRYLSLPADLVMLGGDVSDRLYYSDFTETLRIYADATGSECATAGERTVASEKRAEACGARFGCHLCTAIGRDKSLETMLESDERYDYMQGLNRLQRFLLATRWDWTRRNWLGRTINKAGYQRVQPDTYSPRMVEALFRYCLTLDIEEAKAAAEEDIAPRFRILSPERIVAIDAEWLRYGLHRPFHALALYLEIMGGERYPVPEIDKVERTPRPAARYVHVGRDWDEGHAWTYTGLRTVWELFGGCPTFETTGLSNGREVWDVNTADRFEVDAEAAGLILSLEAEHLVREYHDDPQTGITRGYETYLALGTVALNPAQRQVTDTILRRTAYRARRGLAGPDIDVEALLESSISAQEMRKRLEAMREEPEAPEPEEDETEPEQLELLSDAA